jgi:predicted transcriptional regulator
MVFMDDAKETQKTTLNLDTELHKRLRVMAIERGTTFSALVTEALTQYLEREQPPKGGRKR